MKENVNTSRTVKQPRDTFRGARDFLLAHREDYEAAYHGFQWPQLDEFNWAIDWFDALAEERPDSAALWVVEEGGDELRLTFAELKERSNRVANFFRGLGVERDDRILVVLGNSVPLWETMLAAMKLGAVLIPAATLLLPADLADRIRRGNVRHVVATSDAVPRFEGLPGDWTRVVVGAEAEGWISFDEAYKAPAAFEPRGLTKSSDTLLLYFTSGTTAQPKLVEHTHASYPIGHLSTMYWIGLQPGDIHLNLSSSGWAKHAWSCFFAPWNAGACVLVHNYARFRPQKLLDVMARCGVTTFCAPPTVWRMLVQEDLQSWKVSLREVVSGGEPLNPEVIEQVRAAWDLTIRDGYGQTETTAQIGNTPGQRVKLGSMGRPLPGYAVVLVDPTTDESSSDGEICLELKRRPLGLMKGYRDDAELTQRVMKGGFYHTGDLAAQDEEGYVTSVGRVDDVFKSSDYRISPFELESVLIEHPAVAEAAVIPSPDPIRWTVPKAYVVLAAGYEPTSATAFSILKHCREHLAPYKRIRRLEFGELPKTISGKIRRVELRAAEESRTGRAEKEFRDEDFPPLKG